MPVEVYKRVKTLATSLILKYSYSKRITRQRKEERTSMFNVWVKLLNSKTEWHQPKLKRRTQTGGAAKAGGRVHLFPQDGASGALVSDLGTAPAIYISCVTKYVDSLLKRPKGLLKPILSRILKSHLIY